MHPQLDADLIATAKQREYDRLLAWNGVLIKTIRGVAEALDWSLERLKPDEIESGWVMTSEMADEVRNRCAIQAPKESE